MTWWTVRSPRFLSTLSLRRATPLRLELVRRFYHFYPRSPCGERRSSYSQHVTRPSGYFYPRSPCGERLQGQQSTTQAMQFLSTLSLRRATDEKQANQSEHCISIHALLAESDVDKPCQFNGDNGFLSTLSLRRATVVNNIVFVPGKFLSTLSLRRATMGCIL